MKEFIKKIMKKVGLYENYQKSKNKRIMQSKLTKDYKFENRMKNKKKVCFILAGYKEFAYDIVFGRIKEFVPKDVEVCILSSGKYSKKLSEVAKENDWSYLSTKRNNVSLIQNQANYLFKNAEYIFKLDEDIFITKNFFDILYKTYKECEKNGEYKIGFVAPTIPINGFSHMLILERFGLKEKYTKLFEKPKYIAGPDRMVENNPEVAKFFWGYKNYLPNIDEISNTLQKDEFSYVACPIRFSIGAIMYTRKFWEEIGMFTVLKGNGMGADEAEICGYAIEGSNAIIVSKNVAVGHLSFGTQNTTMKEYFLNNKEVFDIHNIK